MHYVDFLLFSSITFCEHIITFLGRRREDSLIQKISQELKTGNLGVFLPECIQVYLLLSLKTKTFQFLTLNTLNALHGSISVLCLSRKSIEKQSAFLRYMERVFLTSWEQCFPFFFLDVWHHCIYIYIYKVKFRTSVLHTLMFMMLLTPTKENTTPI